MDYMPVLNEIKERYTYLLGDNLVGIYVHGSIAFNCFNWAKSDIDYLVVINRPITPASIKADLINETLRISRTAPPKGLEMSVVLKEHCMNFIYPTPFELHYSAAHKTRFESNQQKYCDEMNGTDIDLAAHFTVTKKEGFALCGEPVSRVFGNIPAEYYFDSIKCDIQNAKEDILVNPVYIILNLCRVLAYKEDNQVLSKERGGLWGLEHLDKKYHFVIGNALECYKSDMDYAPDSGLSHNFCDYMLSRILIHPYTFS